jgi:hypothetical protein
MVQNNRTLTSHRTQAYCKVDTHALAALGVSAQRKYSLFCGVPISITLVNERNKMNLVHRKKERGQSNPELLHVDTDTASFIFWQSTASSET